MMLDGRTSFGQAMSIAISVERGRRHNNKAPTANFKEGDRNYVSLFG